MYTSRADRDGRLAGAEHPRERPGESTACFVMYIVDTAKWRSRAKDRTLDGERQLVAGWSRSTEDLQCAGGMDVEYGGKLDRPLAFDSRKSPLMLQPCTVEPAPEVYGR